MADPSNPFQAFAASVADAVCWQQGVGSEWDCECLIDAVTLAGLVRLAFTAPAAEREEFLRSLTQDT